MIGKQASHVIVSGANAGDEWLPTTSLWTVNIPLVAEVIEASRRRATRVWQPEPIAANV